MMIYYILAALVSIGLSSPTLAQHNNLAEDPFQHRFQEMAARLDLAESQRTELEPILRSHFLELQALFEEYDLDRGRSRRPSRSKLLAFRGDAQALNQHTDAQVEAILSPAQMEAYRDIQDESRARMRAQLRR